MGALTHALPRAAQFIDGQWSESDPAGTGGSGTGASGTGGSGTGGIAAETIFDPANGGVLGSVPHATASQLEAALAAARRAADSGAWASETPRGRSTLLYRLQAELAGMAERLLDVLVAETGCPVTLSRGQQVGLPIRHLEYWAEAARS